MRKLWGTLDLLFLVYYLSATLVSGRIPLISGLKTAEVTSVSFVSPMPLVMAASSVVFMISLFWSAYALLLGRRVGRALVYGQFPFRFLFVMPSVFFIPWLLTPWLSEPIPHRFGVIALMGLMLGTEIWKLVTVRTSYLWDSRSTEPMEHA